MTEPTQNYTDDEIDLFELFEDIKEQWKWLFGVGFVCTLAALIYALVATPSFQTEIVLKPVKDAELLQLNRPRLKDVLGFNESYITSKQAFSDARAEALSSNTIREFYNILLEEKDPNLLELIYNPDITTEQNVIKFSQRFSHADPGPKESDPYLRVKFDLSNAELAAQTLNRFSEFVLTKNKEEVQENVTMQIQAQLEQWEMKADELRDKYFANKSQRLVQLAEAAAVAQKINQQNPVYGGERFAIGSQPPLYMMGQKALRAEIKELESRDDIKNETTYISGLTDLLWKIKTAKEANISWDKVSFVQQDQSAVVPLSPIKPKKKLIVAVSVVAGGMLGIFMALVVAAWKRRQQSKLK